MAGGLGILCSYRFTDKRAVMKGSENAEVEEEVMGAGTVSPCACMRPCTSASRSLRFVSKTRECHCLRPAGGHRMDD